jgi:hypothetical protein
VPGGPEYVRDPGTLSRLLPGLDKVEDKTGHSPVPAHVICSVAP